MLYGFGGWAKFPWAAYVAPSSNILMAASPGAIALSGPAESFVVSQADRSGAFSLAGISQAFAVAEKCTVGSFSFSGVSTPFRVSEADGVGSFALAGFAITDLIGEAVNSNGRFVLGGVSVRFVIAANARFGSFTELGIRQELARDFVNWVNRPLGDQSWDKEASSSSSWIAFSPRLSSWHADVAPTVAWSPLAPPSSSWVIDPAQQILPPVSE